MTRCEISLEKLAEFADKNIELNKELEDLRNGKKGACSTCDPVAQLNIKLEKENDELKKALEFYAFETLKDFKVGDQVNEKLLNKFYLDGSYAREVLKEFGHSES